MLLSLAILIASGRLVPRALMRQRLTASDGFLLASIVNAIGLFATDALTYKWGGMSDESADAPAPPEGQVIALKKVWIRTRTRQNKSVLTMFVPGPICRQCLLRHWDILAEACNPRALL